MALNEIQPEAPPHPPPQPNLPAVPMPHAVRPEAIVLVQPAIDYVALLNTASSAIATTANIASYAIGGFGLMLAFVAVRVFGRVSHRPLADPPCMKRVGVRGVVDYDRFSGKDATSQ